MKWCETGDKSQFVVDDYGNVTAMKRPNSGWERTYLGEYSTAPKPAESFSTEVIRTEDLRTEPRISLADMPFYYDDFSKIDAIIADRGLLTVVRCHYNHINVALVRRAIERGDIVTQTVIFEEMARYLYGSHAATCEPSKSLNNFKRYCINGRE